MASVHQHQYQRFAGGLERLDQRLLFARNIQAAAAGRFVRHAP
jgi:hypothetical protein